MYDSTDLEARGIPTVFVASTEFRSGAEMQAELLGFEPEVVYVPHPIQDRTDIEMAEIAAGAFAAVVDALTT